MGKHEFHRFVHGTSKQSLGRFRRFYFINYLELKSLRALLICCQIGIGGPHKGSVAKTAVLLYTKRRTLYLLRRLLFSWVKRIHPLPQPPHRIQKRLPEKIGPNSPEIIEYRGEIIIPDVREPCSQKAEITHQNGI